MTSSLLPPTPPACGVVAELDEVRRILRGLQGVLWAAQSPGDLMETVAVVEELKSQADAIEFAAIAELEATKGVHALGWASTKDFVTAVGGGHKGSGPAAVRMAEAFGTPVYAPVAEAMADGWLSRAKANVIERAIDALPVSSDVRIRGVQVLLEEAKRLDASELRQVGRRLIETVDPDGTERREERAMEREERAAHLHRELSVTDDGIGGARIRGRCSIEDSLTIKNALLPLAKPQPTSDPTCAAATCQVPGCSHDGRDPRDHGARMLDALVEAFHRLATVEVLPESHGAVPRVSVTISYDDLRAHLRDTGFGTAETGEDVSAATVRRLACDAEIIPIVLGTAGAVLDVGRQQRLVTTAIWRGLVVRDQHCRFPGCSRPPVMCHAHHAQHWADGGVTSLDNMILLCGHHHRLIHAGPWTIRRTTHGLVTFTPPDAVRRARGVRPDRAPPDG